MKNVGIKIIFELIIYSMNIFENRNVHKLFIIFNLNPFFKNDRIVRIQYLMWELNIVGIRRGL